MRNPLKDFFYFSREERRGIIILIIGIILVFLSKHFYLYWKEQQVPTEEEMRQHAISLEEYHKFVASIKEQETQQEKRKRWEDTPSQHFRKQEPNILLAPFNPNTADSATFCNLGLPSWMAHNILIYRNKGGKFRKVEDFKKIYGMTEERYQTLRSYICIAPEDTVRDRIRLYNVQIASAEDSLKKSVVYKYPAGTVIDLNQADTTELKKIPGIGSGIANRIASYRARLGGFYAIEQLQDIDLDPYQLQPWFRVDAKGIRPINLNRSSVERLRNHPYINFYQAKALVEYRKKKGSLQSLKPFAIYEEFSEADLERISHYVCFE